MQDRHAEHPLEVAERRRVSGVRVGGGRGKSSVSPSQSNKVSLFCNIRHETEQSEKSQLVTDRWFNKDWNKDWWMRTRLHFSPAHRQLDLH